MEKLQQMADMLEFSYCDAFEIHKFTRDEEKFAKENGIAVAFVLREGYDTPYDTEVKVLSADSFDNMEFNLYGRDSATEELDDFFFENSNVKLIVSKGTIPAFFEGQTERKGLVLSASVPYVKFPLAFSRKDERMTEGIIFYLNKKPNMTKANKVSKTNENAKKLDDWCKESK